MPEHRGPERQGGGEDHQDHYTGGSAVNCGAAAIQPIALLNHSELRHTVVIPNATAQDRTLSLGARGLLVMMLSQPAGFAFSEAWLCRQSPSNRDQLRRYLKELETGHYLFRMRLKKRDGRCTESRWEIWPRPYRPATPVSFALNFETDRTVAAQGISPRTDFPSVDKPIANTEVLHATPENSTYETDLRFSKTTAPQDFSPQTENPSVDRSRSMTWVSSKTADETKMRQGKTIAAQEKSPQTENPSVERSAAITEVLCETKIRTVAAQGISPRTENPSVVGCYKTADDDYSTLYLQGISAKNVHLTAKIGEAHIYINNLPYRAVRLSSTLLRTNPPISSLRYEMPPPTGGGAIQRLAQGSVQDAQTAESSPLNTLGCCPESGTPSEAPRSPRKASKASPTCHSPKGGSGKALPAFAEAYRELLSYWWVLRRQRHKAPSGAGLTSRSVRALEYARDAGVLQEFCEVAAESGWLSLGFNGHKNFIDQLAAEASGNLSATTGHPRFRTVRSGQPFTGPTNRSDAAVERAKAMFAETPCSNPMNSSIFSQALPSASP